MLKLGAHVADAGYGTCWLQQFHETMSGWPRGASPSRDTRRHGSGPTQDPCLPQNSNPAPPTHLHGAGRFCGARYPYEREACRDPGVGSRGRRVRDPEDGDSRPAKRWSVLCAETWPDVGRHKPRAPPSSRGAPPCRAGHWEGEFPATRFRSASRRRNYNSQGTARTD